MENADIYYSQYDGKFPLINTVIPLNEIMDFYEQFKIARNRIRKFDTLSLIVRSTEKLHEIEQKSLPDWGGWMPWNLLLLIKWSAEYGGKHHPPREFRAKSLIKLANQINDFSSSNDFLSQADEAGIRKFMRVLAFQQFWYQRPISKWKISRQYILFCECSGDDPIERNFKKQTGLTPNNFLKISLFLYSWFAKDSIPIFFDPYPLFKHTKFTTEDINNYLGCTSLTIDDLRKYIHEYNGKITNPYRQLAETTPLINFPLLKTKYGYLLYSRTVFEKTILRKIYNITKEYGKSELAEFFSVRFENHINEILKNINLTVFNESTLFSSFPNIKTPDFLIPLNGCSVMLEAKAIEMRPSVQVFPANKQLEREFNENIIKAIIQGFSLANELIKSNDNLEVLDRNKFYLFIITYRDLYLGPGDDFWNEFAGEIVEKELKKLNIDNTIIPPKRIVVLSIDEFDTLCGVINSQQDTLDNILAQMEKNNSDPGTKKFSFSMHLSKYTSENLDLPGHKLIYDKLWNEVIETINHQQV